MLTEDVLEDRDARAFFKGRAAVAVVFLITPLRDLAMDFVVFATFFKDDVVLEGMECIDGEDRDEWRYDDDCDKTEFWRLIV